MKGQWPHSSDDIVLTIDVAEVRSSTSSGQSEWVEVGIIKADGSRGVIRIERRARPTEEPGRRISL